MRAQIEIQAVWNQNKGVVQLFIGDFIISMPPEDCAALERDLASARTMPERAETMAAGNVDDKLPYHAPWPSKIETVADLIKREAKERSIRVNRRQLLDPYAKPLHFIPEPRG